LLREAIWGAEALDKRGAHFLDRVDRLSTSAFCFLASKSSGDNSSGSHSRFSCRILVSTGDAVNHSHFPPRISGSSEVTRAEFDFLCQKLQKLPPFELLEACIERGIAVPSLGPGKL
jgi:hypothetical protein